MTQGVWADDDTQEKEVAAVKKFLKSVFDDKTWESGPTPITNEAIEKAYPDQHFYYVFSSAAARKADPTKMSQVLRVNKKGQAGVLSHNEGLITVAVADDAKVAAAAIMSLHLSPDGPVSVAANDVEVNQKDQKWDCKAVKEGCTFHLVLKADGKFESLDAAKASRTEGNKVPPATNQGQPLPQPKAAEKSAKAAPGAREARVLPPLIAKTLAAFPADTETIVVGRSFEIAKTQGNGVRVAGSIEENMSHLALGPLDLVDNGRCRDLLAGRNVELAMLGGRDYETVTSFGGLRFHGCAIIKFTEDLGETGDKLIEQLRAHAKKIETISKREVFIFETSTARENVYKVLPWEVDCLVRLAPDVLLAGTSTSFVTEVLERWDGKTTDRALPDDLPEWKYVDSTAALFLLRHLPDDAKNPSAVGSGMVFNVQPADMDAIEFFYLPRDVEKCEAYVRRRWPANLGFAPTIEHVADGALCVAFSKKEISAQERIWLQMFVGTTSQGESFAPASGAR